MLLIIYSVFKDEFATVDDLSKEEIDEKLGALAAKMDKNGDGEITQEELTMWIHYVQTKYFPIFISFSIKYSIPS